MQEEDNLKKIESLRRLVEGMQKNFFGDRFVGASFSKVNLCSGLGSQLSSFILDPKKFLVIIGPPGTGKTYMCSAFLENVPEGCRTIRAYSERKLFEKLREGIASGHGDYLANLHYLIDDDLVILDDIGSSGHNKWREEVLMETLDYRYKDGKKTIITSNLTQNEFNDTYGKRITSRLFALENTIINLFGMPDMRLQGL